MDFKWQRKCNVEVGQHFFGIVQVSNRTYDGVWEIIVDDIDYNLCEVIFKINQPCKYVVCSFDDMNRFVFESENEARAYADMLEYGEV